MSKKQEPLTVEQMDVQISQAGETAKRVLKALFDKPTGRSLQLTTTSITKTVNEGKRRDQHKTVHQVRNALDRLLRRGIVLKSSAPIGSVSAWALNLALPAESMAEQLDAVCPDAPAAPTVSNDIVLSNDLPTDELAGQDSIA